MPPKRIPQQAAPEPPDSLNSPFRYAEENNGGNDRISSPPAYQIPAAPDMGPINYLIMTVERMQSRLFFMEQFIQEHIQAPAIVPMVTTVYPATPEPTAPEAPFTIEARVDAPAAATGTGGVLTQDYSSEKRVRVSAAVADDNVPAEDDYVQDTTPGSFPYAGNQHYSTAFSQRIHLKHPRQMGRNDITRIFEMKLKRGYTPADLLTLEDRWATFCRIWDPGPDLTSEVVRRVNELLGVKHSFSIANRHESNGVESTNRLILRHIRNMCLEVNVRDCWSDPLYLQPLKFVLNTYRHTYTGVSPWILTFGTDAFNNLPYPTSVSPNVETAPTLVRALDDHLKRLRDETKMFQDSLKLKLVAGRMQAELIPIGELVLLDTDVKHLRPQKLSASRRGPFQVHAQNSNNILLRDLVTGALFEAHIGKLSLFCGTIDQALHLARYDHHEFTVRAILSWQGDPFRRSEMFFQVQYTDGDKLWQPYREVVGLEVFDTFINLHPELHILTSNAANTSSFIRMANKKKPHLVLPYTCFVDIRIWGPSWYLNLGLPDAATTRYVIETRITSNKGATLLCSFLVLNNYRQTYPYYYAHYWFTYRTIPSDAILVTPDLVIAFPSLLETDIALPIPTELPSLQETDNFIPTVIPPTITVSRILQRQPTTPHQHLSPDDVNDEDCSR